MSSIGDATMAVLTGSPAPSGSTDAAPAGTPASPAVTSDQPTLETTPAATETPTEQPSGFEFDEDFTIEGIEAPTPVADDAQDIAANPTLKAAIEGLQQQIDKFEDKDRAVKYVLGQTANGRTALALMRATDELSKPVEEGGVGYRPSIEQIKNGLQALGAEQQLISDFRSDSPEAMGNFISFWTKEEFNAATDALGNLVTDPVTGRNLPGPALRFAAQLPFVLARNNPQAYSFLKQPIEAAYAKAVIPRVIANTGRAVLQAELGRLKGLVNEYSSEDDKRFVSYAIALMEHDLSQPGVIDELISGAASAPAGPTSTPLQPRTAQPAPGRPSGASSPELQRALEEVARLKSQISNFSTTEAQRTTEGVRAMVVSEVMGDVANALSQLKDRYPARVLKSTIDDLVHEYVTNTLPKVQSRFNEAVKARGNSELVKSVVQEMRQIYGPSLRAERTKLLTEAGGKAKASADAALANRNKTASNGEANGSGSAIGLNGGSLRLTQNPNETKEKFLERSIAAALGRPS